MNTEDAIRDLVRAIKGNSAANDALDLMASALCDEDEGIGLEMIERIQIERYAV